MVHSHALGGWGGMHIIMLYGLSTSLETIEQDALMPPNLCGKLEDLVAMCVCCLIVFDLSIHSLY